MIYAFCTDESFSNIDSKSMYIHSANAQKKLGVLTDDVVNRFLTPAILEDIRFNGSSTYPRIEYGLPISGYPYGTMQIHFDYTTEIPLGSVIRADVISENDQAAITNISANTSAGETYRFMLFNIIEYCFMSHTSNNICYTQEQLETDLISASTNRFKTTISGKNVGYVTGSLNCNYNEAVARSAIKVYNSGTTSTSIEMPFYSSISFTFATVNEEIEFKIWLNIDAFMSNYPKYALVKCIFPCDPKKFIDLDYDSVLAAITDTSSYKDQQLQSEIEATDHTGLYTYKTKYINSSYTSYYMMPFSVLYKGGLPDTNDIIAYVKEMLVNSVSYATEAMWKERFPDLFVSSVFYLIPFYSNRVYSTLLTTYFEKSIFSYSDIKTYLTKYLRSKYTDEQLYTYGKIIQAAGCHLYVFAFPDPNNAVTDKDLDTKLPNYVATDSTGGTSWTIMDEETQQFAKTFAEKIKRASSNTPITGDEIETITIEGIERKFIKFTNGSLNYILLINYNLG